MGKFINLLKENKLLTAITAIHLLVGPFLYDALGFIDITTRDYLRDSPDLGRLFKFDSYVVFYWVVTVVLVFMFWLFKK